MIDEKVSINVKSIHVFMYSIFSDLKLAILIQTGHAKYHIYSRDCDWPEEETCREFKVKVTGGIKNKKKNKKFYLWYVPIKNYLYNVIASSNQITW